ncbi:hypothetical protein F5878DRAFT_676876 [Lentinula raphanica]|uniref:Uncharacterized protein n=1 Tax=Lentinula raphanica TaxID=153919 RepID=A0AA38U2T7_9AGAR|nr:hypothetical protein F5878DRAFT_676876 [Lentinula raphanica]
MKAYSHSQVEQHKKDLSEWHKSKARTATSNELDFGIYLDLYQDNGDFDDDNGLPNEDPSTHGQNPQERDDDWEDVEEDEETKLYREANAFYRRSDGRSRRNKIHIDQLRWSTQLDGMTDAYMDYCYRRAQGKVPVDDEITVLQSTKAIDVFSNTN